MNSGDKIKRFIKNYRLIRRDNKSGWRRRAFKEYEDACKLSDLDQRLEKINSIIDLDVEKVRKMNIENKFIKC